MKTCLLLCESSVPNFALFSQFNCFISFAIIVKLMAHVSNMVMNSPFLAYPDVSVSYAHPTLSRFVCFCMICK